MQILSLFFFLSKLSCIYIESKENAPTFGISTFLSFFGQGGAGWRGVCRVKGRGLGEEEWALMKYVWETTLVNNTKNGGLVVMAYTT